MAHKKSKQKGKYLIITFCGKPVFRATHRSRARRRFAELKGKFKGVAVQLHEVG